jgi:5-methyltetrahydropteroyltriglutamate--homocysteine methyltransferase
MKLSTDRILTTHSGSMPRGEPLGSLLIDQEEGKRIDRNRIDQVADERVAYITKKEVEVGLDIPNDGEQGRVGFQTYVPQRWSGFGGKSSRPYGREFAEFPKFTTAAKARSRKRSTACSSRA